MDIAVGLILATYFGAIVKSLVNDILMPPIGKLMSGVDFSKLKLEIFFKKIDQKKASSHEEDF